MNFSFDISVVIVNYNVKDFLHQCLTSLESSRTKLKIEIIVVDNNSQDNSVELLRPQFPRVKFIASKENLGFGRANNVGFKEANGQYLLILNPDTIVEEATLDHMYQYMEDNAEVGIAGCKVLNGDGTFQLACRRGFPTPWASFCKLFGLQQLLPNSKLFAQYNQTFKSVDETYYIDAVIGAFMFARNEAIQEADGFDPEFFMYGEDLDLCFRVQQNNWKISYVHSTSIIHYKGESTKRSTINEVRHFYEAMEIFAKKHFGKSPIFLTFLRSGIYLRAFLAYINKYKKDLLLIISDIAVLNISFLIATKYRTGAFLGGPEYYYPWVLIFISIIVFVSTFSVGGYFEKKNTLGRSFFGIMISFFFLSSLTYFFKEFVSSRIILLVTIGFAIIGSSFLRIVSAFFSNTIRKLAEKRILIVGNDSKTDNLIESIQAHENQNINIIGAVYRNSSTYVNSDIPNLGSVDYIDKILTENKIDDVIITDNKISRSQLIKILSKLPNNKVRFHIAHELEEYFTSDLISDITGTSPSLPDNKLSFPRYRFFKRVSDIVISLILLTIGLPFLLIFKQNKKNVVRTLLDVFLGKTTMIGIYSDAPEEADSYKPGIISMAKLANQKNISENTIKRLNNYYIQNYKVSLDFEILLKYLFRK